MPETFFLFVAVVLLCSTWIMPTAMGYCHHCSESRRHAHHHRSRARVHPSTTHSFTGSSSSRPLYHHHHHHHPHSHRHHGHSKASFVYRQLRHQLSLFAGLSSGDMTLSHQFKSIFGSFGASSAEVARGQQSEASAARRHTTMPKATAGDNALSADGFAPCSVVSSRIEAEGTRMLVLDVPAMVLSSHTAAGQYVKLRTVASPERQSKTSYFAIASPPPRLTASSLLTAGERYGLSILLKDSPSNEGFWQAAALEISTALGGGFGIEDALSPVNQRDTDENLYEHVLLVATGTGAAPIAAAIDSIVASPQRRHRRSRPRRITLLLGVRHPKQLPFAHRMQQWVAEHDVRVVPVFSQVAAEPSMTPSPFEPFALTEDVTLPAHYGYVQDVVPQALVDAIPDLVPVSTASQGLSRATRPSSPVQTLVLLCGQPDMMAAVTDLCLHAGVPIDNIRKNF